MQRSLPRFLVFRHLLLALELSCCCHLLSALNADDDRPAHLPVWRGGDSAGGTHSPDGRRPQDGGRLLRRSGGNDGDRELLLQGGSAGDPKPQPTEAASEAPDTDESESEPMAQEDGADGAGGADGADGAGGADGADGAEADGSIPNKSSLDRVTKQEQAKEQAGDDPEDGKAVGATKRSEQGLEECKTCVDEFIQSDGCSKISSKDSKHERQNLMSDGCAHCEVEASLKCGTFEAELEKVNSKSQEHAAKMVLAGNASVNSTSAKAGGHCGFKLKNILYKNLTLDDKDYLRTAIGLRMTASMGISPTFVHVKIQKGSIDAEVNVEALILSQPSMNMTEAVETLYGAEGMTTLKGIVALVTGNALANSHQKIVGAVYPTPLMCNVSSNLTSEDDAQDHSSGGPE